MDNEEGGNDVDSGQDATDAEGDTKVENKVDVESLLDQGTIVEKELDDSADSPALAIFAKIHPAGIAAIGAFVAAVIGHLAFDTERLVGNMMLWQWVLLIVIIVLSFMPAALNSVRASIEFIGRTAGRLVWVFAWFVFFAQLFNVVTRFANPLVAADILIGQVTSVAWQLFALIALLGLPYGVIAAVNPRIDFWWAEFTDRSKAWLDFVMHTFFFLPFLFSMTLILRRFAATALGQRFGDKSWPSGWRIWETWEQSPDAGQLAVGPIKAFIFVGFVMFALQIGAEIIKTGFVLMGKREYAQIAAGDEFQRIE